MEREIELKIESKLEGLEVVDFGDAMIETKQFNPLAIVLDSCCTWSYFRSADTM